jgi:hypothetical protein
MPKGALEVIEYVPRQAAMAGEDPPDYPRKLEDLRLEHRTLTSCAAALAAVALHILFLVPALWAGGGSRHPQERYHGDAAMQWVVLNGSSRISAITPPALRSPMLRVIGVTDPLPAFSSSTPLTEAPAARTGQGDEASAGAMYGRYIGQVRARIDRAWQRPRTAIGAGIFQCQVRVDQDSLRQVTGVTLLQCNGFARWRLSLVRAIKAASPLPAPPNQAVFAHRLLLTFRASAYSPGAPAQLYEPSGALPSNYEPEQREADSENALRALRKTVRAPRSPEVIELRIDGSSVKVEPQHQ